MYAVIETGGKQYRVQEGDIISVEKLGLIEGETYDFDKVLMIADEAGIKTGAPYVEGATVKATVITEGRGKKVYVYKYKSKRLITRRPDTDSILLKCRLALSTLN